MSGDGCSAVCTLETGYACTGGTLTTQDYCGANVGDNVLVAGVEECDDGNAISGDGCSDQGKVEFSHYCFANPDPGSLYACVSIDQSTYIHDTIANMCGYITYLVVAGALVVSFIFTGQSSNGAW